MIDVIEPSMVNIEFVIFVSSVLMIDVIEPSMVNIEFEIKALISFEIKLFERLEWRLKAVSFEKMKYTG
jgi:hypothetical protein